MDRQVHREVLTNLDPGDKTRLRHLVEEGPVVVPEEAAETGTPCLVAAEVAAIGTPCPVAAAAEPKTPYRVEAGQEGLV